MMSTYLGAINISTEVHHDVATLHALDDFLGAFSCHEDTHSLASSAETLIKISSKT